jgi:gluconate 2-dehydrogenase alpha chain
MAFGFFDKKSFNDYMGAGALGVSIDDYNGDFFDHGDLDFLHGGLLSSSQIGNQPIGWNLAPPGTPAWGKEFKQKTIHYANRAALIFSQSAAMPHRYNYLSLDPTYKDAYGNPLLRMTINWTDNERKLHTFMTDKARGIAKQMGADHIMAFDQLSNYSIAYAVPEHSVGGTIMGEEPGASVVNSYSQSWDVENLFVVGASTFANQSGVNPTGTVGALAYRASEGIVKYSKQGGRLV